MSEPRKFRSITYTVEILVDPDCYQAAVDCIIDADPENGVVTAWDLFDSDARQGITDAAFDATTASLDESASVVVTRCTLGMYTEPGTYDPANEEPF